MSGAVLALLFLAAAIGLSVGWLAVAVCEYARERRRLTLMLRQCDIAPKRWEPNGALRSRATSLIRGRP